MALILVCAWPARQAADTHVPLTTLEYQILGTQLRIQPPVVNVPKGIAGSILPRVGTADGQTQGVDAELLVGTYVEALLRGPAFPSRRLVGRPNEPLLLPPLSLVGDYQLDGIRLVDAASGATRLEGLPSSVPVRVFDEVLISKVTSRPLSLQEIQAKGIVVDGLNFRAVEFEVGFVLDGQTIPIRFPVIAPDYGQAREIIPAAEQYRRLVAAQEINNRIAQEFMNGPDLPAELETRSLNLVIKGVNFERVDDEGGPDLRLAIPPIPALVVIPGNIGYLHQFFSVQVFTENGAPLGSGLTVFNARARVELPPGPDGILSTNYAQPGDDPLRLARVGPEQRQYSDLPIVRREPTPLERFGPGEGGQAEFLVEGLQEGLHTMDFDLSANLDGLAAGTVKVRGRASGSVLVRNPKFSLAFAHPKTVQAGEPYEAHVTLLNTGDVPANLLSITLRAASISGGRLETPETVQLGSLEPGQSATAAFRVRAQRSGAVSFSNLTTGEDSVQGRFNLRMGIDERGVELSPDSLALPGNVNALPAPVIAAAQRVLGQALSAATAGRLPAGVKSVSRAMITRRALELAEAGQRLQYGDSLPRVLADLLLDWQGGRAFQDGFDQIMIGTDAGREFREAIAKAAESAETVPAVARLIDRAPDLAGRGEAWTVMASSDPRLEPVLSSGSAMATLDQGSIPQTGGYRGTHGHWLVTRAGAGIARWVVKEGIDTAEVAALRLTATGTGELWRWSVGSLPAGACLSTDLDGEGTLLIDQACDGTGEGTVSGTRSTIRELPPSLVTAQQDTGLVLLRPQFRCSPGPANNYGHVLAVLFSKPMLQTNVEQPSAYTLDDGNVASGVRIQPGGRVALLSMQQPFSALRPRVLTVADIADARGNRLVSQSLSVQSEFRDGVAMNGKVLRADGSPAASVPVTVTMYEAWKDPFDRCDPIVESRVYQQLTDSEGNFTVDFVLGGAAYTVSAVDTGGLPLDVVMAALANAPGGVFEREKLLAAAVATNLFQAMGATSVDEGIALAEGLDRAVWRDHIDYYGGRMGKEIVVALKFRGRGTVAGRVLADAGGTPVARAAVNLYHVRPPG